MISRREFIRLAGAGAAASTAVLTGCGWRAQACKQAVPNLFTEAGRPLLVVVEGQDTRAMLRAGLEALGGLDKLTRLGKEAIFRGNYVTAQRYPATTAPAFICQVSDELKRAGFRRTTFFDSHGSELAASQSPQHILNQLGVPETLKQGGVDLITRDFFDSDNLVFVRNPKWQANAPVGVFRELHEASVVVSLPVVKRHGSARFTCALKMHFGSVGMADRGIVHSRGENAEGAPFFDHRTVHFADTTKPQLNIVDARTLVTRRGPTLNGAVLVPVNRLILCGDMVATDAYCARLMAEHDPTFSVDMIALQLKIASDLGLGTADLDSVKIVEVKA